MNTDNGPAVPAESRRRFEDERFVTGRAHYVPDLVASGEIPGPVLRAAFARSTEAHARILDIDISAAVAMPGVTAVYTDADLAIPPIPGDSFITRSPGMERPVLARDAVRFVGEAAAIALADSKAQAVDAAAAVWLEVDALPVVVGAAQAAGDEVLVHPAAGTNIVERWSLGDPAEAPSAPLEVTVELENGRLVPNSIEPLAVLAVPDRDRLVVYASHQGPHILQRQLATLLGLDQQRIRVVIPAVGGAFGMKGMLYPEYLVIAAAALRLNQAVEWVQTRREHFLMGTHGRGQRHRVTLRGDEEGRILAAHVEILAEVGAYPHNGAPVPTFSRLVATGLYDIPHVSIGTTTVVTNLAPTGSYRGAGRPEAAFAIERAIDAFARATGLDPLEVRRRNLITKLPHTTPTGAIYDSGDYGGALDMAAKLVDVEAVRAEQRRRQEEGGDPIGLGVASFVERAGGAVNTGEFARVELLADGTLEVRTGSTSSGQGHQTVWAQIAAAAFETVPTRVRIVAGDTDLIERGTGTAASRSTMIGGSAVWRAATSLAIRVRSLAAELLGLDPVEVAWGEEGPIVTTRPQVMIPWGDLVTVAEKRRISLVEEEWYEPGAQTFPYGVHIAVVEVSLDTGAVRLLKLVALDDVGNVINPMVVDGQIHGSLMQGIGQALLEGVEYSPDGQLSTASFMDYAMPRATDQPEFVLDRMVTPAPSNPLGAKGAGETGCIGAPPAIVNAVLDALAPWGVTDLDMPLTPPRVWRALTEARRRA